MSKFKTRYIKYTDRSFKKKFENLINDERKSNNKINSTVTKILKEILEKGDDGLNYCVSEFDKIKANYKEEERRKYDFIFGYKILRQLIF